MSFARIWRWTCDGCQRAVEVHGSGLPKGWFYVPGGINESGHNVTTHRCAACGRGPRGKPPRDSYASDEPVEVIQPSSETGGRVPPCRSTVDGR